MLQTSQKHLRHPSAAGTSVPQERESAVRRSSVPALRYVAPTVHTNVLPCRPTAPPAVPPSSAQPTNEAHPTATERSARPLVDGKRRPGQKRHPPAVLQWKLNASSSSTLPAAQGQRSPPRGLNAPPPSRGPHNTFLAGVAGSTRRCAPAERDPAALHACASRAARGAGRRRWTPAGGPPRPLATGKRTSDKLWPLGTVSSPRCRFRTISSTTHGMVSTELHRKSDSFTNYEPRQLIWAGRQVRATRADWSGGPTARR